MNLSEVTVQEKPDEKFYRVSGPNLNGEWTVVERPIDDTPFTDSDGNERTELGLKTEYIADTKKYRVAFYHKLIGHMFVKQIMVQLYHLIYRPIEMLFVQQQKLLKQKLQTVLQWMSFKHCL
jgi:hypothetical protein